MKRRKEGRILNFFRNVGKRCHCNENRKWNLEKKVKFALRMIFSWFPFVEMVIKIEKNEVWNKKD